MYRTSELRINIITPFLFIMSDRDFQTKSLTSTSFCKSLFPFTKYLIPFHIWKIQSINFIYKVNTEKIFFKT